MTDRDNLEWLVHYSLTCDTPTISISRGRELLGFRYMEEMREWLNGYDAGKYEKKYIEGLTRV